MKGNLNLEVPLGCKALWVQENQTSAQIAKSRTNGTVRNSQTRCYGGSERKT